VQDGYVDLTEYNELKARQHVHFLAITGELRRLLRQGRPSTPEDHDHLAEMGRAYEQLGRDAQNAFDRARGLI
jgi:hypothetical protein